jgi:hypothetical protein
MKINGKDVISSVERPAAPPPVGPPSPRPDRVTLERGPSAAAIASAASRASGTRAARLRELEAAVKSGNYRPDASQIADQILDAADVDARLRALLNG